jgi:hypothetical protein
MKIWLEWCSNMENCPQFIMLGRVGLVLRRGAPHILHRMSNSDIIAICNMVATVAAVIASPVIALWIGGKLQARANARQQQLNLLGVLLSLRAGPE